MPARATAPTSGPARADSPPPPAGPWSVAAVSDRLLTYRLGSLVSLAVHVGHRLGLYRALRSTGPATAGRLADAASVHPRFLAEWLALQEAAQLVTRDERGRYRLPPAAARTLTGGWPAGMAGVFASVPWEGGVLEGLIEAFRTGDPLPPEAFDDRYHAGVEELRAPWLRFGVPKLVLPRLPALVRHLRAGARVLDLGCGSGTSTLELARAFPRSEVVGVDRVAAVVERAADRAAQEGIGNARFVTGTAAAVAASGPYTLVTAFDCIHEDRDPQATARAVRSTLAEDGIWLVEDFRPLDGGGGVQGQEVFLRATALLACLHRGGTPVDGAPGALGFDERRAAAVAAQAGFEPPRVHDVGHPLYLHYEFRPAKDGAPCNDR